GDGAVAPVDRAREVAAGSARVGVGEGGAEAGGGHALDAATGVDRARRQGCIGHAEAGGAGPDWGAGGSVASVNFDCDVVVTLLSIKMLAAGATFVEGGDRSRVQGAAIAPVDG